MIIIKQLSNCIIAGVFKCSAQAQVFLNVALKRKCSWPDQSLQSERNFLFHLNARFRDAQLLLIHGFSALECILLKYFNIEIKREALTKIFKSVPVKMKQKFAIEIRGKSIKVRKSQLL